ncbi:MAG TPA: NADH-ubiquinone oxidoreductase-F iron-sulfur binding region domain-containing protein [Candidatus Deferrimicrobiaceae bacterium]|nr:NADH-ubiquinone oxidoreductase-F iron-sulfur binding region domain-containing protein [Candidatus Deferrimicrobiaceae bacterium]
MTTLLRTPSAWPAVLLARRDDRDPTDLAAAVRAGAFGGLTRAVRELGPAATIGLVEEANLRGRGGGGHLAAEKWRAAARTPAKARYVVANGYGADPGATTDRALLETDPYAVIEGAAIAAFAIGAEEVHIAVRATATEAIRRLEAAIVASLEAGFIGDDALESGRRIEVAVRPVQGAYLLGEETVLLKALESKRGQPEQRPPHPATRGLHDLPTVVHNVQTLAAVPYILHRGAPAFRAIGDAGAPGTILVEVRGPGGAGVAEVPLGTPLRDVIALVGAPARGRKVKAVVVGGPAGGILPPARLDTPYTFEALREAGAHVGSGSVIVADDRACIVDLARVLTRFCADEACGKTIPCRIGLRRIAEIGERLTAGTSRAGDLERLADLSSDVVGSALCDHERLATLPLMSGLRYFRAEVDAHLERGECPAGVCRPVTLPAAAVSGRGKPTRRQARAQA